MRKPTMLYVVVAFVFFFWSRLVYAQTGNSPSAPPVSDLSVNSVPDTVSNHTTIGSVDDVTQETIDMYLKDARNMMARRRPERAMESFRAAHRLCTSNECLVEMIKTHVLLGEQDAARDAHRILLDRSMATGTTNMIDWNQFAILLKPQTPMVMSNLDRRNAGTGSLIGGSITAAVGVIPLSFGILGLLSISTDPYDNGPGHAAAVLGMPFGVSHAVVGIGMITVGLVYRFGKRPK